MKQADLVIKKCKDLYKRDFFSRRCGSQGRNDCQRMHGQ